MTLGKNEKYNKVYIGLLLATATIIAGYAIVTLLFEGLASVGLIDDLVGEGASRMDRTVWLIAICCNIIGIQVFSKRKSANIQRGIALITVVAAGVWVFYFKDSLFLS